MEGVKIGGVTLMLASIPNWVGLYINNMFMLRPVTIAMAIAGASLSFMLTDKQVSRSKMFKSIVFFSFIAIVATALAPNILGAQWIDEKQAPFAGALAAIMQNIWPLFKEYLPEILRKVIGLGEYSKVPRKDTTLDITGESDDASPTSGE